MNINIWTAKIYVAFKINGFDFLYMHVTIFVILFIFHIFVSMLFLYVVVFILKADKRGE